MPQININEIDQSVFSRVVNDDRVRVLVPGIASFGPVYDGTNSDDTAVTFTDVTEFDKVFGYTEPEYNPFPNDVSRTYAKQLINRGAAVSFIRVNQGVQAIYNIGGTEELPKEIVKLIKGFKEPYILTGNDQSVILMTDPSGLNGLYIKANGKIMDWVSVNAITGGLTFTSQKGIQYVHMMKIVSTAGDTCYITIISPMAKRSTTNYLTVKLYIAGGLTTAEGTSAGSMIGEFACSGYNSTTNKTIVALDLGENKFVYSDGTKSPEALSSSNTTVTGNIYGQKN